MTPSAGQFFDDPPATCGSWGRISGSACLPRRFLLCPLTIHGTAQNLGVTTPHFETGGVPNAPRQRDPLLKVPFMTEIRTLSIRGAPLGDQRTCRLAPIRRCNGWQSSTKRSGAVARSRPAPNCCAWPWPTDLAPCHCATPLAGRSWSRFRRRSRWNTR
jgi:hypothetical protein